MPELVLPSEQYEPSYLASERERLALGRPAGELALDGEAFRARLARLAAFASGVLPQGGRVPSTTLWLVDGDEYLGRLSIRHVLDDRLRVYGGHIGYDIRPSRRGQGLGGWMLRAGLPHAKALGIDPAMLTVDAANIASWRMIERCGGTRESTFEHDGAQCYRYWLPTTS
jgi:predicted acetyltransferase